MLYKLPVGDGIVNSLEVLLKGQEWLISIDKKENENYVPGINMPPRAQGNYGYILEYDFYYPEETHQRNNDFPPAS